MPFATIPELLEDLAAGRLVVLVDDEDRENEGDLVVLADRVRPEQIVFMLREARGLLCLSLDGAISDRLGLEVQGRGGARREGTAFTETIDAVHGISTGVSAQDRLETIRRAIDPASGPASICKPGHIQPLRAREGGVLVRPGHTEGSVDLARLCGASPAALIIEIMNADGTMARLPDLERFTAHHGLKMATIAELIEHRRKSERLVERAASARLPTRFGEFDCHIYTSPYDPHGHVALTRGIELPAGGAPGKAIPEALLGRVHSECLTGDVFGSRRCDCGDQLDLAMERIAAEERGFLLYMRQEGRGIGLLNKLRAYSVQDSEHLDTVEANLALGFKPDQRHYGTGAQILFDLGLRKLRLLTNNPGKRAGLAGYGLEIIERVPIQAPCHHDNRNYLHAKQLKLGHLFEEPT